MTSLFRKFTWWLQRRRKEDELREELQFHLARGSRGTSGRRADGRRGAMGRAPRPGQRDAAAGRHARAVDVDACSSSWRRISATPCGRMFKNRAFTALAALSLALGIGANTAIYSFMDAILLRSLPVSDPASLVVMKWRSRPFNFGRGANGSEFVMRSIDGSFYDDADGRDGGHFPVPGVRAPAGGVGAGPVQPLRVLPGRERERDDQGRGGARRRRVRLRRLFSRPRGVAGRGPSDRRRRRSRRRAAGRRHQPWATASGASAVPPMRSGSRF